MKLVRRPYNGRGIMEPTVRAPWGRCTDATFCNGKRYIVTQVSLLYRSPSFVLLASIAGEAIDIKDRAGCANKRPYYSLGTFSLWREPNVSRSACRPSVPSSSATRSHTRTRRALKLRLFRGFCFESSSKRLFCVLVMKLDLSVESPDTKCRYEQSSTKL